MTRPLSKIYLVTNQRSAFNPIGYSILSVKESLEMLSSWDSIAFDSETEGFDPYTKGLISVQFGKTTLVKLNNMLNSWIMLIHVRPRCMTSNRRKI